MSDDGRRGMEGGEGGEAASGRGAHNKLGSMGEIKREPSPAMQQEESGRPHDRDLGGNTIWYSHNKKRVKVNESKRPRNISTHPHVQPHDNVFRGRVFPLWESREKERGREREELLL